MDDQKTNFSGILKAMALTSTLGMEIAAAVTLGFFGGRMLDGRFGTEPWLMIAGILIGMAAGILGIINTVKRFWDT